METRRFIAFLVLSMAILIGWTNYVAPLLNPPPPKQPAQQADAEQPGEADDEGADVPEPDEDVAADDTSAVTVDEGDEAAAADDGEEAELAQHPSKTLMLGSLEPETGYFAQVELTTDGAAIVAVRLNDPRYRELTDRKAALKLIGSTTTEVHTLDTAVHQIDGQLKKFGTSLREVDWEVAETTPDPDREDVIRGVTFRYRSPDGSLEVRKHYSLDKVPLEGGEAQQIRDTHPEGYKIGFQLTVANLGEGPASVSYELQGPVGLRLENEEHTYKFRDVKVGFLNPEEAGVPHKQRGVDAEQMTAKEIAKPFSDEGVLEPFQRFSEEDWQTPLKYIGVDVQYFAALLFPLEDQLKQSYIEVAVPTLLDKEKDNVDRSDISVYLKSGVIPLEAGNSVTHQYELYAGPKRQALLEPLGADDVLEFGYFGFIAKPMVRLLKFFHESWGMPYGIAIIMLTLMVRGAMFPLSRKQALGAKKMKELQPKIKELKQKYANQKEKMAKAQMELFSKHNYNPLAGCLPIFIQMPIFFGLYTALRNSVDLRMSSFLYIDNLAAPDALFVMPFELPFLGQDFNLLPLVTVVLFIGQQKMFMPPPTDKEQEMQYKMMNFMMLFMGFLFYHVPAGLCVYFIASSLWGMGERKLLEYTSQPTTEVDDSKSEAAEKPASREKASKAPKKQGLWGKLMAQAEAAAEDARSKSNGRSAGQKGKQGKSKRRSKTR